MSIHSVDKTTGDITLLSGGTLWSDMPVGSIIPYGGSTAPEGALLCDGAEYLRADYPELFAVIGTSFGTPSENTKFKVPDLREAVPVGAGTSTRSGIATHDAYNVGEFKDDQIQEHAHKTHLKGLQYAEGALWATAYDQDVDGTTTTGAVSARVGTTTHGKQLGVTYVIKAKQTALPVDFQEGLEAIIGTLDVADSAVEGSYVTAVSETDGKVSVTREAADAAPTESSNKMVKSGGVYVAEQKLYKIDAAYGVKNLAPRLNSQTINNVTFDINDDGSVTVNGTATADCWYNICGQDINNFLQAGENYIASGCPEGGSDATFFMYIGGSYLKYVLDDTSFTCDAAKSGNFYICVRGNTVMDNVVFYPMIRLASYVDDTYEPYAKTNQELTAENEALTNQANDMVNVLGAKNLIPFPYYNTSKIQDGITWTVNSDGSISASGTATANSFFRITQDSDLSIYNNTILSGCPANGEMWSKWALYLSGNKDGQSVTKIDEGSGVLIEDIPSGYSGGLYAKVINGQTVNFTFKPMIRLASIQDDTYAPHSMTNQQITPYIQAISNPNLLDNPWFTVNQRGVTSDWVTQFAYGVDRWRKQSSASTTLQKTDDGISEVNGLVFGIFQTVARADVKNIFGKVLTFSIMYSDGSIEFGSAELPSSFYNPSANATKKFLENTAKCNYLQIETFTGNNLMNIVANVKAGITIRAVKLELGSVSTLAQDTAPNYATELLKCQRYFLRLTQASAGFGICNIAGKMDTLFPIPVAMRALPTATLSGDVGFVCSDGTTKSGMESVSVWGDKPINNIGLFISKTGLTVGLVGRCYITTSAYIDLSADL